MPSSFLELRRKRNPKQPDRQPRPPPIDVKHSVERLLSFRAPGEPVGEPADLDRGDPNLEQDGKRNHEQQCQGKRKNHDEPGGSGAAGRQNRQRACQHSGQHQAATWRGRAATATGAPIRAKAAQIRMGAAPATTRATRARVSWSIGAASAITASTLSTRPIPNVSSWDTMYS